MVEKRGVVVHTAASRQNDTENVVVVHRSSVLCTDQAVDKRRHVSGRKTEDQTGATSREIIVRPRGSTTTTRWIGISRLIRDVLVGFELHAHVLIEIACHAQNRAVIDALGVERRNNSL